MNKNIKILLQGIFISILITTVLIAIYSAVLTYTELSENYNLIIIVGIDMISIFVGGFIACKQIKEKGLLNGSIIGLFYAIFIYLISSLISKNFTINLNGILVIVFCIILGMCGGIVGVNRN